MSTVLLGLCWPLQMGASEKAVLISLADQANDAGVCWPSQETISRRTCLSDRTVRRALANLEKAGLVTNREWHGRAVTFQLLPGHSGLAQMPARTQRPTRGATMSGLVGHSGPQNHHRTINEPSKNVAEPKNGHPQQALIPPEIFLTLPLRDGTEFDVTADMVREFDPLYPAVDVEQTLREIKGWMIGNSDRRKTRRGILKCVTSWLQREQEKHGST